MKINYAYDGLSWEMERVVSPDHAPIPVHFLQGRIRSASFHMGFRGTAAGVAHTLKNYALCHLPQGSLFLGGRLTVVASDTMNDALINIWPLANGPTEETIIEYFPVELAPQLNTLAGKVTLPGRAPFGPGFTYWQQETFNQNDGVDPDDNSWDIRPRSAAAGALVYAKYPVYWHTPVVWMVGIGKALTMGVNDYYGVTGHLDYVVD